MSNYYEQKQRFNNWIEKIIKATEEEGLNLENMYYLAGKEFGYSKTVVNKAVEILKNIGLVKIEVGHVIWIK